MISLGNIFGLTLTGKQSGPEKEKVQSLPAELSLKWCGISF